jgi:nucleotide-binding universal stress UspA family protein
MKTILAAVDNSLAVRAVLATGRALAEVLGAELEAVHVQTDGDRTARSVAEAAGVALRFTRGSIVERLAAFGERDDVVAVVIGARGTPSGRPLGRTAAAVATALPKPVAIVPPDVQAPTTFRRVLVPLEGGLPPAPARTAIFDLAAGTRIDVVALHVLDEESIPSFTDQPQHEHGAWTREFLARYAPSGLGCVQLETRVGRADELVAVVAEECGCDLIALGWSQELAAGRAPIVRATLQRSRLPVLLVPLQRAHDCGEGAVLATGRSL